MLPANAVFEYNNTCVVPARPRRRPRAPPHCLETSGKSLPHTTQREPNLFSSCRSCGPVVGYGISAVAPPGKLYF